MTDQSHIPEEKLALIRDALQHLSEEERVAVELMLVGESTSAIAEKLGRSRWTIRRMMQRAVDTLKPLLTDKGKDDDQGTGLAILPVYIDPGNAPEELITEFFVTLAALYRSVDGSGLQFCKDERKAFVGEVLR